MIDNLIADPMKQIWINWSYTLKDINFLIFRDFFRNFLIFSKFKINLFNLNSTLFLAQVMGQDMEGSIA